MCAIENDPSPDSGSENKTEFDKNRHIIGQIYDDGQINDDIVYVVETNQTFRVEENDYDEQYWAIYTSNNTLSYCDRIRQKLQRWKWWIIDISLFISFVMIIFIIVYVIKLQKSKNNQTDFSTNSTTTISPYKIAIENSQLDELSQREFLIDITETGWSKYFK